jgi:hypothetical protein
MPSTWTQDKSMRYEPPAINFHLGETPPREPQGGGEHTVFAALRKAPFAHPTGQPMAYPASHPPSAA